MEWNDADAPSSMTMTHDPPGTLIATLQRHWLAGGVPAEVTTTEAAPGAEAEHMAGPRVGGQVVPRRAQAWAGVVLPETARTLGPVKTRDLLFLLLGPNYPARDELCVTGQRPDATCQ
jgi:hypothetical protein